MRALAGPRARPCSGRVHSASCPPTPSRTHAPGTLARREVAQKRRCRRASSRAYNAMAAMPCRHGQLRDPVVAGLFPTVLQSSPAMRKASSASSESRRRRRARNRARGYAQQQLETQAKQTAQGMDVVIQLFPTGGRRESIRGRGLAVVERHGAPKRACKRQRGQTQQGERAQGALDHPAPAREPPLAKRSPGPPTRAPRVGARLRESRGAPPTRRRHSELNAMPDRLNPRAWAMFGRLGLARAKKIVQPIDLPSSALRCDRRPPMKGWRERPRQYLGHRQGP
ncbi:hypothetical protein FQR65_LT20273 [Abscondita terminalis]|nr:hypothetical protein FQR65_LT20273 [Abscondita terminalis]